jgi:hypothetical protein
MASAGEAFEERGGEQTVKLIYKLREQSHGVEVVPRSGPMSQRYLIDLSRDTTFQGVPPHYITRNACTVPTVIVPNATIYAAIANAS